MSQNKKESMVFMVADEVDGTKVITLGVSKEAWEYMKDGKTHTFDFSNIGLPIKLIIFGAEDNASAVMTLQEAAKAGGIAIKDMRGQDFSIKDPTKH